MSFAPHFSNHITRRSALTVIAGASVALVVPAQIAQAAGAAVTAFDEWPIRRLRPLAMRLGQAQSSIGHGRFNLASFDDVRAALGKHAPLSSREENEFAALFALDARRIGFLGPRVVQQLSAALPLDQLQAVPPTGQHVFPAAFELFMRARKVVGEQLIVTSGARGVPKQMLVFINSALHGGMIARPVHSVAPPGYSYHAVGDIDVGDRRLGGVNFTEAFANSPTYKTLAALAYIHFRYPRHNPYGVQFEPWHLQIAP